MKIQRKYQHQAISNLNKDKKGRITKYFKALQLAPITLPYQVIEQVATQIREKKTIIILIKDIKILQKN